MSNTAYCGRAQPRTQEDWLPDYIADHYGDCRLSQFQCHAVRKCAGGRICPEWIPETRAKTWAELATLERARRDAIVNMNAR